MTDEDIPDGESVQAAALGNERSRVLALVTDAFGGYGGIAQYNRDFLAAAAASKMFADIRVIPRITPLPTCELPSGLHQERPSKSRIIYTFRAIFLALRTRPAIIFNAHVLHGPLALLLARLTGATLVSQVHGTEVWHDIPRLCRLALEKSALIFAVSRDTRSKLLTKLNIEPERIVVLGNTFGDTFIPGNRDAARSKYGLGHQVSILTVSRLDERDGYKGHDRIIRLLPQLRHMGRDVIYLIAGVGPDHQRLAGLASALGVAEHVRFLGMVPPDDLPELYLAADLFALPSTGEGFGIVFLEAMACGTPAIGLAVGGVPDALGDGALGSCTPPEAFGDVLKSMIVDGPQRDASLPSKVRERFGREEFGCSLTRYLKLLLHNSSRSRHEART